MPGIRDIMRSEQFINMISDPNAMRNAMQQARQLEQMGMLPPGGMGGLGGFGGMGGGAGGMDPWGAPFGQQAQGAQGQAATGEAPRGPTNLFNQSAQPSNAGAGAGAGIGAGGIGQPGQMPDFSALQQMMQQFGGGGAGASGPFGGFGGPGSPPAQQQQQDSRPPEERYASQLVQLQEMGFVNGQQNIRALQACGGNVQAAVEYLISSQGW